MKTVNNTHVHPNLLPNKANSNENQIAKTQPFQFLNTSLWPFTLVAFFKPLDCFCYTCLSSI